MADNQDITVALEQMKARASGYQLYARYYAGDHALSFATEKMRNAFGALFRAFSLNYCAKVVRATKNRLILTGFSVEDGGDDATDAWGIWKANRMDQQAGYVHQAALLYGDGYVIVWPGADGQPVLYPNDGDVMTVAYDSENPGVILWAAKRWVADLKSKKVRLNMYYPDRIEKYISRSSIDTASDRAESYDVFEAPGEPWPLSNPYGAVPVFHFANDAPVGKFGRSELVDVIPIQNALNKEVMDLLVNSEFSALPQRVMTGIEADVDPDTGKPKAPFFATPGGVWTIGDPDAKGFEFTAGNVDQFLKPKESLLRDIAAVSDTPMHFLIPPSGEWPSGESLKTAESEFLAKVLDRQIAFGNRWEDVLAFALRVASIDSDARLSALWKDPAPHSEADQANVAVLKSQVGVSNQQLQRELGYSEEEIEHMAAEKAEQTASLGNAILTQFEQGQNSEQP